jgi:hypothetical protein
MLLSILWLLCLANGCNSHKGLVAVTGHVTYQGKPLEQGSIVFLSPHSRQVTGEIKNGEIVNVTTFHENDGIAAGEYEVAITSRDRSEKYKNNMAPPSLIPDRYADVSTSGLKAEIQSSGKNVLQFELK